MKIFDWGFVLPKFLLLVLAAYRDCRFEGKSIASSYAIDRTEQAADYCISNAQLIKSLIRDYLKSIAFGYSMLVKFFLEKCDKPSCPWVRTHINQVITSVVKNSI